MNRTWFALAVLSASLLCSCQSTGLSSAQSGPALAGIREVSCSQLKDWMAASKPFTLIDVREDKEWSDGHAAAALHISRWTLSQKIDAAVPDKNGCIVLYCLSGKRSAASAVTLQRLGYTNVYSLAGGLRDYERAGLPTQR
jgi:rhodanese-related sulfurtransferase